MKYLFKAQYYLAMAGFTALIALLAFSAFTDKALETHTSWWQMAGFLALVAMAAYWVVSWISQMPVEEWLHARRVYKEILYACMKDRIRDVSRDAIFRILAESVEERCAEDSLLNMMPLGLLIEFGQYVRGMRSALHEKSGRTAVDHLSTAKKLENLELLEAAIVEKLGRQIPIEKPLQTVAEPQGVVAR